VSDATATIPEERFQQEVERRKAAERQAAEAAEQHAVLNAKVADLTGQVESMSGLQAQLQSQREAAEIAAHHVGMLEAGVRTQSVRDFMLHQHQRHAEQAGAEAQPWSDWFSANRQRMIDDLTSLSPPAPAVPAVPAPLESAPPVAPPVPVPQTNNGAQPTPPPTQSYVPGSISGMSLDDFKAQRSALLSDVAVPWASSS